MVVPPDNHRDSDLKFTFSVRRKVRDPRTPGRMAISAVAAGGSCMMRARNPEDTSRARDGERGLPVRGNPTHRPTTGTRTGARLGASLYAALVVTVVVLGPGACAPVPPTPPHMAPARELPLMGYSIQVGAFSRVENAIRLTAVLEGRGLHAYYFLHRTGLYKVRFGDYSTRESAFTDAERLRVGGLIDEYRIVSPEDYAVAQERKLGREYLRGELVATARSFIGLP